MNEESILFDTHKTEPDTNRSDDRSWIFQGSELLTMQYSEILSSPKSMAHAHDNYEQIIMVLVGKANFWCDDEYYELSEGYIMVVPPHIPRNIQQCTGNSVDLKILEIFCPADPDRPQSPKARDLGHFNQQNL